MQFISENSDGTDDNLNRTSDQMVCLPRKPSFSCPFEIRQSASVKRLTKREGSFIGHHMKYNMVTRLREKQPRTQRFESEETTMSADYIHTITINAEKETVETIRNFVRSDYHIFDFHNIIPLVSAEEYKNYRETRKFPHSYADLVFYPAWGRSDVFCRRA